jgi:2-iminoacetate synthase
MGQKMIDSEIQNIPNEKQRARAIAFLQRIRNGENDLRF